MFSIITEVPPPPPLQMPAIPYFPEFCFSTDSRDKTILEPDILHYNFSYPTGWPKATAPPFTLIFSIPMSKSFIFASTVTAKASLISWKSMLLILRLFIVAHTLLFAGPWQRISPGQCRSRQAPLQHRHMRQLSPKELACASSRLPQRLKLCSSRRR